MAEDTEGTVKELIHELREMDRKALIERGIFHGIPIGLGTFEVAVSPQNKFLCELVELYEREVLKKDAPKHATEGEEEPEFVNSWRLSRPWRGRCGQVSIWKKKVEDNGKIRHVYFKMFKPEIEWVRRLDMSAETFKIRTSITLFDAEIEAQRKLKTLVDKTQWVSYVLTDTILEEGKSGVTYLLRKNRPTIALRQPPKGRVTPLAALCLHPLAWYPGSWAGAMPPSDEVIAHLLLIRADEHYYWRKANQIPLQEVVSGV